MGTWKDPSHVAKEVLDEAEARWSGPLRHAVTRAESDDSQHLECRAMVEELVAFGWTRVGEAVSPLLVDGRRAVLRVLVSADRRALAAVSWRIRQESLFFWKEQGATCEIVSRIDDGRLLVTVNGGWGPRRLPAIPGVACVSFRVKLPARRVARAHRCRTERAAAAGRELVPIESLDDALRLLDLGLAREAALRRSIGFVSPEEIRFRDADEPHARAFEAERRARRRRCGDWRSPGLDEAIAAVLGARGRAVEELLPRLLDAFAEAGDEEARAAVARAGGADALLLHVHEQARDRGPSGEWPCWDAFDLRRRLWDDVRDRPRVLAALLRVPSRSATFEALDLIRKAGDVSTPTAARTGLLECLTLDRTLRHLALPLLAKVASHDGTEELAPLLRGDLGPEGIHGALHAVKELRLPQYAALVREVARGPSVRLRLQACDALISLGMPGREVMEVLALTWAEIRNAAPGESSAVGPSGRIGVGSWGDEREDLLRLVEEGARGHRTLALEILTQALNRPDADAHRWGCDGYNCTWCRLPEMIEAVRTGRPR